MLSYLIAYACFAIVSLTIFYLAPPRHRWLVLVVSGAAFLASVGWVHLVAALALASIGYIAGLLIERWPDTTRSKVVLWLGIALVVGALGLCKYHRSVEYLVDLVTQAHGSVSFASIILPLGISYYAFQVIGYQLEVYWGREQAERHPGRFAASVLFFPKLVAGPIERPHRFLEQLTNPPPFAWSRIASGLEQIGWGLFKKAVIADHIGLIIDHTFDNPTLASGAPLFLAICLYPVQVYNDFSGYTDIALGTARLFGFELTPNFNRPFSARSISDFWRRWHISLSSWTNDYVYKPLAFGLRSAPAGPTLAVLAGFFVLGAWHGPRLTFVLFGLVHGSVVAIEAFIRRRRGSDAAPLMHPRIANALTVGFYALTCVFFRSATVEDAGLVLGRAVTTASAGLHLPLSQLFELGLVLAILFVLFVARRPLSRVPLADRSAWVRWTVYCAIAGTLFFLGIYNVTEFVYEHF